MKFYLVFALFICPPIFCISQKQLTIVGVVSNEAGVHLENANVIAVSPNDKRIINFTHTQPGGLFRLDLATDFPFELQVSMLGYKKWVVVVDSGQQIVGNLEIRLESGADTLSAVIVTAKPVRVSGDTTSFAVKPFTDNSERVLEDVLQKLPGFEVDKQTGEIKYQGKPVVNVLIDGADLAGRGYQVLSRNLPADFARMVQVIQNFNENQLWKDFSKSNQIALNIVIHDTKKNRLAGSLDMEVNSLKKEKEAVKLLKLQPKFKIISASNHNTIGSDGADVSFSDISEQKGIMTPEYGVRERTHSRWFTANPYRVLPFKGEEYIQNNLFEQVMVFSHQTNSNFSVRGSISGSQDRIHLNTLSTTIFNTNLPVPDIYDSMLHTYQRRVIKADINIVQAIGERTRIQLNSNIILGSQNTNTEIQSYPNRVYSLTKRHNFFNTQQLVITHKLSERKLLEYTASFNSETLNTPIYFYDTVEHKIPDISTFFNAVSDRQVLNYHTFKQALSYVKRVKTHIWKYTAFHNISKQDFSNDAILSSNISNPNQVGFGVKPTGYLLAETGAQLNYSYISGITNLLVNIATSGLHYEVDRAGNKQSAQVLQPSVTFNANLKIKRNSFSINIIRNVESPDVTQLVEQHLFINYRALYRGNNPWLTSRGWSGFFNYSVVDRLGLPGPYVNVFVSNSRPAYQAVIIPDSYFIITNEQVNTHRQWFFNLEAGGGIWMDALATSIKFKESVKFANIPQEMADGELSIFNTTGLSHEVMVASAYKGFFNFKTGLTFSHQRISSRGTSANNYKEASLVNYLDLHFNLAKELVLKQSLDLYHIRRSDYAPQSFSFLKMSAEWNPRKSKLTLFVKANNLFNNRTFLLTRIDSKFISYTNWRLKERNFSLGARVSF